MLIVLQLFFYSVLPVKMKGIRNKILICEKFYHKMPETAVKTVWWALQ